MMNIDPLFKSMLKEHPYIKEIKRKSKNLKKEKNEWKRKYNAILSILHDYPGIAERNIDYRKDMIDLTHDDRVNNDDSRILLSTSDNIINLTNDLHVIKSENESNTRKVVVKREFPDDGDSCVCADADTDDDESDDEFKCKKCMTVAPLNCCLLCDRSNICEYCEGSGGDYGKTEAWVCYSCLPTCLTCADKLHQGSDDCCGNGRSDDFDDESSTAAVSEEHQDEHKNACTICKTDMGSDNSRQLCCKTHCGNEEVAEMEVEVEVEVEVESVEMEDEEVESVEMEVEGEEEESVEEEDEEEEEVESVEMEVEVEEVEVEEEEVEEEEGEEEEGEEVFGVEVDGKLYYTNDEKNGEVYEALDDDELGDVIGEFKNGKLKLF